MFDYLIVGCGLSGATCARLLAEKGMRVLVVEKRNHIGGNVYDYYNEDGILVHKYGPHIFHTKVKTVWAFLSRFTKWRLYQHRVLAYVDGMYLPMPINLDTINMMYGTSYDYKTVADFLAEVGEKKDYIENAEDMVISKVGRELYEKFFLGYTTKQWGLHPQELEKEVTARIPIRHNRDSRYFTDPYQGIPREGYTKLIENMLSHPRIGILLNTDFKAIVSELAFESLIFTGPIDYYFDCKFGKLPYRSLEFEFETYDQEFFQPVATVNYPNDYEFTRITEFKHMTGQKAAKTTVVKEYPRAEGEPYYPIPSSRNRELYRLYAEEAKKLDKVYFTGRLATYKYANMDVVVKDAMDLVELITESRG